MNTFGKAVVKVSEDKALLDKLRRLRGIEKDEHGEFIWAQVGGEFIGKGIVSDPKSFKMYLGNEVEMPQDFATKLVGGWNVPLDKPCPQCFNKELNESTGFTVAGICHMCKGNRFIDLNRTVPVFVIVSSSSGDEIFDPAKLPAPKAKKEKELATARA